MNKENRKNHDAKGLFLAFSDLISNDEEFVDEFLREEGTDPKALEEKGKQLFQKHFLQKRLAFESQQKTSFLKAITERVANMLPTQLTSGTSTLVPGVAGTRQQIFNVLCNRFKDFSPEDLNGIMQDEDVLKEILKEVEKSQKLNS